jgi:hypothetical protein
MLVVLALRAITVVAPVVEAETVVAHQQHSHT